MKTQEHCLQERQSVFSATGERLLRSTSVAHRIQRTPRMVRYLAERCLIKGFKRGKLWLFNQGEVERYCRSRERNYE